MEDHGDKRDLDIDGCVNYQMAELRSPRVYQTHHNAHSKYLPILFVNKIEKRFSYMKMFLHEDTHQESLGSRLRFPGERAGRTREGQGPGPAAGGGVS